MDFGPCASAPHVMLYGVWNIRGDGSHGAPRKLSEDAGSRRMLKLGERRSKLQFMRKIGPGILYRGAIYRMSCCLSCVIYAEKEGDGSWRALPEARGI